MSLIITILSMVYVFLYAIQKREHIYFFFKKGIACYTCKSEIDYKYAYSDSDHYRQCKSCYRDEQLSNVLNNPIKRIFNKRFLISTKFSLIGVGFNLFSMFSNILQIFFRKSSFPFGLVGSILLFIGMTIFYIHYLSITRKKQK